MSQNLQDDFLDWLKHEKRYSEHTLNAYRLDLFQFTEYALSQYECTEPSKVGSIVIRSWLIELMEQGFSKKSVHRKLSSLRSYYKYLRRQGEVTEDPVAVVQAPKLSRRLPVFVEEQPMEDLFNSELFSDDFSGLRDELMVTLLYETGMRRAELIGLRDKDVDFNRKQLKVTGKRNKERIIPLSELMIDRIREYMENRISSTDDSLLITDKGKKLYPGFVYRKVNYYLSEVTTLKKKSPHILRHTFATHMLNRGADLNSIKEILGHASLAATQVYTHNSIEKLKEVYNKTHPKG